MGNCIYLRANKGEPPEERVVRSELWAEDDGAEVGRILRRDHFANTTVGIWFYWSDLLDKAQLRRELLALVDHVTAPEYRAEEIEHTRERSAWLRGIGEASRQKKTTKKKGARK